MFIPSPFHIESAAIHDELVKGLLSSHLSSLPGGKLDKGTLLPLHNSDCSDLAELVEVISEGTQAKENRLATQTLPLKTEMAYELNRWPHGHMPVFRFSLYLALMQVLLLGDKGKLKRALMYLWIVLVEEGTGFTW